MDPFGFALVGVLLFAACSTTRFEAQAPHGQGIAARYAEDEGIQDDPDVLYFGDFESDSWYTSWATNKPENGDLVSGDPTEKFAPFQGKALRVTIPAGDVLGISAFRAVSPAEEIYFRYYLRFGNNWRTLDGGKLPGPTGNLSTCGSGGRRCNGTDGWSARGAFDVVDARGRIRIGSYIYDGEMARRGAAYGTQFFWGSVETNRWYSVEHHIKMNTIGQRNGIYRGWIDGRLSFQKTDLVFRKVDRLKIESIWMNIYHGGETPVDRTIHLYLDNIVIARSYIGPMGSASLPGRTGLSDRQAVDRLDDAPTRNPGATTAPALVAHD
jgi:hypothetical protein